MTYRRALIEIDDPRPLKHPSKLKKKKDDSLPVLVVVVDPHELSKLELSWSRELTDLVNSKTSSIVFLMETCSMKKFLECLPCDLKQDNLFIVPRVNTRGGLALF